MRTLNEVEREIWINFHEFAYKDDLELCKKIINQHPRWSIISGYYAMHDITKLYLGKIHNIKISGLNTHKQTIDCLKKVLKDNENAKRIFSLLKFAEDKIEEIGLEDVPYLLKIGKKERGRVQYYSKKVFADNKEYIEKAEKFVKDIVDVFIKIMEAMLNVG